MFIIQFVDKRQEKMTFNGYQPFILMVSGKSLEKCAEGPSVTSFSSFEGSVRETFLPSTEREGERMRSGRKPPDGRSVN